MFALVVAIAQFTTNVLSDFTRTTSDITSAIDHIIESAVSPAGQAVFNVDRLHAQKLLDGFSAYPYIIQSTITDDLDTVFANVNFERIESGSTNWLTELIYPNHSQDYSRKLTNTRYEGEIGILNLKVDHNIALRDFYHRSLILMLSDLLHTILIFIIIYLVTYRFVTSALVQVVDSINKNIGTTSKPLHINCPKNHNKTEIGVLVSALNQTISQRSKAQYELSKLNEELEERVIKRTAELEEANQRLHFLATKDPLTNINNRRGFFQIGGQMFNLFKRYGRPLTVIMLDIDHFKLINDKHGHKVGDEAIICCAKTCGMILRDTDVFGRIGGEEFAIILSETNRDAACELAERIRLNVPKSEVLLAHKINMTVSIGIHELQQVDQDFSAALEIADKALYEAKNNGRNQVKIID